MEIHSVLPEERAKDEHGNILPWAYRYSDASRNPRQPPEESGPFGRHRTTRYTGSRSSRTRTGTTPVRQKENPTVAEFGRLLAIEQQKEEAEQRSVQSSNTTNTTSNAAATTGVSNNDAPNRAPEPEAVATECLLYGYSGRASEWKVLSKFERIVSPSVICEDYPREDPDLFLSSTSAYSHSRAAVVVHTNLSKDALRKSRTYRGGEHWIKVTFDSYPAAERACFYSPVEVDGHLVFCEMWQGRGPFSDAPLLKGSHSAIELQKAANSKMRTLTTSQSTNFLSSSSTGVDSAVAGFERATQTLPRSFTAQDVQYGRPSSQDDGSVNSSTTASSATATDAQTPTAPRDSSIRGLRSRSTTSLPTQLTSQKHSPPNPSLSSQNSEYMTHIPSVRRAVLRPISEALPPQPSLAERVLSSIPLVGWFVGGGVHHNKADLSSGGTVVSVAGGGGRGGGGGGDMIGEGPSLKEDGSWDEVANGWYWSVWHRIDSWLGTDFCGLKDE